MNKAFTKSRLSGIICSIFLLAANTGIAATPLNCGTSATAIHDVQGGGDTSPMVGQTVTIEGIVVGDFQDGAAGNHGDLDGFFVQEENGDADADPATSEGVFVSDGASPAVNILVGDRVRVSGTVEEFDGGTQISSVTLVEQCASGVSLPTETVLSLPASFAGEFEALEGMRVYVPSLLITEYFNFDRYGEIGLAPDTLKQPTQLFEPGSQDEADLAALNLLSKITLDDGNHEENPNPSRHPNGNEFTLSNLFRGGDRLNDIRGVFDQRLSGRRIQPTEGAAHVEVSTRPAQPPDVGGTLKVAAYNVLNYFNGDGLGGGFPTARGASDLDEFNRQRDKIIAALIATDADIVGLVELENDGFGSFSAIQDLVDGLNEASAPDTFAFVDPGVSVMGSGAIAVGLVYKPASVLPVGAAAILDSTADPQFDDLRNRPVLAQTFEEIASGERLTVAVNHFKSKGSACDDVGDPDTGDGSQNCNLTRKKAAERLVDWLATDPTSSLDTDFLVMGDLNSFAKEDPIDVLIDAGYTNLIRKYGGEFAHSFVFSGEFGYLDYMLASPNLAKQVVGTAVWNINSNESDLINYDTTWKKPAQDALYAPDPFRSSDHDPVITGVQLFDLIFSDGFDPL